MMNRRLALAATMAFAVTAAPAAVRAAAVPQPTVTVTGIKVNSVVANAGTLVADATVTLNVVGRTITQNVQIPLNLTAKPAAATPGSCPILSLSLGPIHLHLLGLVVNLDDCNGGPVTVDITATPAGGLLGQLLCDVAGLLDGGLNLGQLLGILNQAQTSALTTALTTVLNGTATQPGLLSQILGALGSVTPTQTAGMQGGLCPILHLAIPNGLHLSVLGLNVDTSAICLRIDAQPGPGNLLGNLLCSLSDLLNNRGNNAKAEQVLVRNILAVLTRLGL